MSRLRARVIAWLRRYGVAELVGTMTAIAGALVVRMSTGSDVASAYGGALGENVGYYGTMLLREMLDDARRASADGRSYDGLAFVRTVRGLVVEFGAAEVLDSLLVRPFAMAVGARLLGATWGVLVGKVAADVIFYVPVIVAYELRRYAARAAARG